MLISVLFGIVALVAIAIWLVCRSESFAYKEVRERCLQTSLRVAIASASFFCVSSFVLPPLSIEIKFAKLAERSFYVGSARWQDLMHKAIVRSEDMLQRETSIPGICFNFDKPRFQGRRFQGEPHRHMTRVREYNKLVGRYQTIILRHAMGSQYRGVEKTLPRYLKPCART